MKKIDITLENYEAYLLDRIEGRLTSEEDLALTDFMNCHNIDDIQPDDLLYVESIDELMKDSDFKVSFDDLKQYKPSIKEEELMFGAVEGFISSEEMVKLNSWLEQDDVLRRHYDALLATKIIPDTTLVYAQKSELKKKGLARRMMYVAVAACLLGVLFTIGTFKYFSNEAETQPIAVKLNGANEKSIKNFSEMNSTPGLTDKPMEAASLSYDQHSLKVVDNDIKATKKNTFAYRDKENTLEKDRIDNEGNSLTAEVNDKASLNQEIIAKVEATSDELKLVDRIQPILPRIAKLGLSRVVSESSYRVYDIALMQRKESKIEQPMVLQGIKQRIEYLDRKSAAIYGFVENQRGIIKSEGLFDIAGTYDDKGKFDGLAIRIAGFEISTAK